jgi:SsrA-binding protein
MGNKRIRIINKQAGRNFRVEDKIEAGIALKGTEVKSLRAGRASINESFVKMSNNEAYLVNAHIPAWQKTTDNYDPTRSRKLLLHKSQIKSLIGKSQQKGRTLLPLRIYFKKNHAKVLIGIGRGLKKGDKREMIRKKEAEKEIKNKIKGV